MLIVECNKHRWVNRNSLQKCRKVPKRHPSEKTELIPHRLDVLDLVLPTCEMVMPEESEAFVDGEPRSFQGWIWGNGAGAREASHSIDPPLEYQVVNPPLIFPVDFPG